MPLFAISNINGNLVNYQHLSADIRYRKQLHLNSSLDSEVLLHLLADDLASSAHAHHDDAEFFKHLCAAIEKIYDRVEGSYSIVGLCMGKGLIAFRDPHGIRPLVFCERKCADGRKDYIFASETTAFYALSFESQGDVQPGEVCKMQWFLMQKYNLYDHL